MDSEATAQLKRLTLQADEALIQARLQSLQIELEAKRAEMKTSFDHESARHLEQAQIQSGIQELRGMDA